jgi:hypothetical protein
MLECWISRAGEEGAVAVHIVRLLDFLVYGARVVPGNVVLDNEVRAAIEPTAAA